MSDTTVTTQAPQAQGNSTEARTPTGELKDQSPTLTPIQSEPEPEGTSFLTQKEKAPDAKPETTSEGDKAPDKEGDKAPETTEGAPEKYADFKLPEGYELDPTVAKEVSEKFKALNLSQDQAQTLVDIYAKNHLEALEAPFKAWTAMQKEWISDIQDRFGSKADAVRRDINSAITNALPPSLARSFKTALDVTGAGSNPDIFEALSILARPHIEGKPVPVGGLSPQANKAPNAPERPTAAEAIYGHLIPNRQQ